MRPDRVFFRVISGLFVRKYYRGFLELVLYFINITEDHSKVTMTTTIELWRCKKNE